MSEARSAPAVCTDAYYHVVDFRSYPKFGVSFWYKRTGGSSNTQGIITNGDCETDPSILITSGPENIGVKFSTTKKDVNKPNIEVR